ncbi:unnamed protein product [Allacma fusca]|uniref:Uncharacterized protein n=1 Tax=Allacma fusca TaxID=39272 RepID=A0A8J2PV72_9HEXA|nr:unnamed protein product [Allacma fusca]
MAAQEEGYYRAYEDSDGNEEQNERAGRFRPFGGETVQKDLSPLDSFDKMGKMRVSLDVDYRLRIFYFDLRPKPI